MPKSTHDRTKNKNRNEESLAGFATSKCRSCLSVWFELSIWRTAHGWNRQSYDKPRIFHVGSTFHRGKAWQSMAKPNSEVLAQRSVADSILLKVWHPQFKIFKTNMLHYKYCDLLNSIQLRCFEATWCYTDCRKENTSCNVWFKMVQADKAMTNRAFSMLVQPPTVWHGQAWSPTPKSWSSASSVADGLRPRCQNTNSAGLTPAVTGPLFRLQYNFVIY